jgi:hypothetical protein
MTKNFELVTISETQARVLRSASWYSYVWFAYNVRSSSYMTFHKLYALGLIESPFAGSALTAKGAALRDHLVKFPAAGGSVILNWED